MKASNPERSSKQRLDDFLNHICPPGIADNDNPIKKSRWVKWQFTKNDNNKQVEFQQREKSESKLLNRLLDRLDPSAGKARHAARCEILSLLDKNGIAITDDIRKHLPDTRKLGNINALGESIQNSTSDKEQQLSKNRNEFKNLVGQHAAEKALSDGINHFMRNASDPVYKKAGEIFPLAFRSILIDFSQNLLKELSLMKPPVAEGQFIALIGKKFKNIYEEIIADDTWKSIRSDASNSIESALDQLGNKIADDKRKNIKDEFNTILSDALMFAGIAQSLSSIIVDSQEDFKNNIKRLVDVGTDENKVDLIFLKNMVGGLSFFLKNKAMKK